MSAAIRRAGRWCRACTRASRSTTPCRCSSMTVPRAASPVWWRGAWAGLTPPSTTHHQSTPTTQSRRSRAAARSGDSPRSTPKPSSASRRTHSPVSRTPHDTTRHDTQGNCPSNNCNSCPCGNSPAYADIASACRRFNGWSQSCCECIIRHESGGNLHAVNHNRGGSNDVGLWQINDMNWSSWCAPPSPTNYIYVFFLSCAIIAQFLMTLNGKSLKRCLPPMFQQWWTCPLRPGEQPEVRHQGVGLGPQLLPPVVHLQGLRLLLKHQCSQRTVFPINLSDPRQISQIEYWKHGLSTRSSHS